MLLHLGHDRDAEGRPLQPSLPGPARALGVHGGQPRRRPARDRAARCADVPRQRLGFAVRGRNDRGEARAARVAARCRQPARADRDGAGHARGWRADGVPADPGGARRRARAARRLGAAHGRDRRRRRTARPDRGLRPARRAGAARLGHDRDGPDRHRRPRPRGACRRALRDAALRPCQAGASRALRRGARSWRRGARAVGRRQLRRARGARRERGCPVHGRRRCRELHRRRLVPYR